MNPTFRTSIASSTRWLMVLEFWSRTTFTTETFVTFTEIMTPIKSSELLECP